MRCPVTIGWLESTVRNGLSLPGDFPNIVVLRCQYVAWFLNQADPFTSRKSLPAYKILLAPPRVRFEHIVTPPMFVVENGWVSLRHDLEAFKYPYASPRTARGVFVLGPSRVSLLIEVNEDLLRGSGRGIPLVVGAILQVTINQELTFSSESGVSITVTYPETSFLGPAMGSVRSLAESVGATLGQYLTVTLDQCDMSVKGIATSLDAHPPSWQLVARLTGIEASSGMKGLASALDCSVGEVRASLRSRGDDAVAQAIPAESSTASGLDEALSRLEAQLQQS